MLQLVLRLSLLQFNCVWILRANWLRIKSLKFGLGQVMGYNVDHRAFLNRDLVYNLCKRLAFDFTVSFGIWREKVFIDRKIMLGCFLLEKWAIFLLWIGFSFCIENLSFRSKNFECRSTQLSWWKLSSFYIITACLVNQLPRFTLHNLPKVFKQFSIKFLCFRLILHRPWLLLLIRLVAFVWRLATWKLNFLCMWEVFWRILE